MKDRNHIGIEYTITIDPDRPISASAINRDSGERFLLGRYANRSKAEDLAPKMLIGKISNPSTQFKRFFNSR